VRVGVTGSTGFIGGALVPALERAGYSVVPVDDLSGPVRADPKGHPALHADFSGDESWRALSSCGVILHLAAISGVMACAENPVETARVNVEGTRRLVERCRTARIPVAFASSLAVVGTPEHLPVTEETPARPTHEYARQKAAGEELTLAPGREGSVPTAVIRMSNVYGSYVLDGARIEKGNVLTLFLQQARKGQLSVNAPGTQRRDFIHLTDIVDHWVAVVRWLDAHRAVPTARTFNAASGESYSVLEIANKVRDLWAQRRPSEPPLRIEVVPSPRKGVELIDPDFEVSRARTERELGLSCRIKVDEFLSSAALE
jgi:nucleoside-diphosphate-sugar epimerase